ncbi:uncharacterized protein LOC110642185 [Hevea brasiliensis]|uniref:uncharacterized protein LOC110642185 n=1 Tax=Hevea brasiliensis TaxID=3981 RepID=UPI000B7997B3|nr:uncharacterized protein LOC110642185 [Hevea brasiliensis]
MADALSHKSITRLKLTPLSIVHDLRTLHTQLLFNIDGCIQANMHVKPPLIKQIKETALKDKRYTKLVKEVRQNGKLGFTVDKDGMLIFQGRMCVPDNDKLKQPILKETHDSTFAMHPGGTTMCRDLKEHYWWRDRLTKSSHFLPVRMDYSLDQLAELYINEATNGQSERIIQVLEDMLRACVMEFEGSWDKYLLLIEFAYNSSYQSSIGMPPYEALYGWKCRTPLCWDEVGKRKLIGPNLMQQTEKKVRIIKDKLKAATDRQKSYVDLKRRDIEYNVRDKAFLKVSP